MRQTSPCLQSRVRQLQVSCGAQLHIGRRQLQLMLTLHTTGSA